MLRRVTVDFEHRFRKPPASGRLQSRRDRPGQCLEAQSCLVALWRHVWRWSLQRWHRHCDYFISDLTCHPPLWADSDKHILCRARREVPEMQDAARTTHEENHKHAIQLLQGTLGVYVMSIVTFFGTVILVIGNVATLPLHEEGGGESF